MAIPIVAAFVLQALFSPGVRALARRGLPRGLSAFGIVVSIIGLTFLGGSHLAEPAQEWAQALPSSASQLRERLTEWRRSVDIVVETSAEVEELAKGEAQPGDAPTVVREDRPGLLGGLLEFSYSFGASLCLMLVLLFLLLAHDGSFLRDLQRAMPDPRSRRRATRVVLGFQAAISTWLTTVTCINLVLGAVIATGLHLLGMPNPILWGTMAAAFNFVPYVGTALGVVVVGCGALLTFESPDRALLAALIYLLCSAIEGGILTPAILGRRLTLNPVVVFVAVMFGGLLWGIAGALLAVPVVMAVKILSEQVPALRFAAVLLSRAAPLDENSEHLDGTWPWRPVLGPGRPRVGVRRASSSGLARRANHRPAGPSGTGRHPAARSASHPRDGRTHSHASSV